MPLGPRTDLRFIKPYTLEETYEVLEAIDNRDWKELAGELGDLLLQFFSMPKWRRSKLHFRLMTCSTGYRPSSSIAIRTCSQREG